MPDSTQPIAARVSVPISEFVKGTNWDPDSEAFFPVIVECDCPEGTKWAGTEVVVDESRDGRFGEPHDDQVEKPAPSLDLTANVLYISYQIAQDGRTRAYSSRSGIWGVNRVTLGAGRVFACGGIDKSQIEAPCTLTIRADLMLGHKVISRSNAVIVEVNKPG